MTETIYPRQAVEEIYPWVLEVFKDLHEHPELGHHETRTMGVIRRLLNAESRLPEGMKTQFREFNGGATIDLISRPGEPLDLYRADMDALSIIENQGHECCSQIEGVMHACGHDFNTACLLGFVQLVLSGIIRPERGIRCLFQRAEESPNSVVPDLIKDGVLEGVGRVYVLHAKPQPDGAFGSFHTATGPVMANVGRLMLEIRGEGGHTMDPSATTNPDDVLNAIHAVIGNSTSQLVSPSEPFVCVRTMVRVGESFNTIGGKVDGAVYSLRHFMDMQRRDELEAQMMARVRAIASVYPDVTVEARFKWCAPTLTNNPVCVEWAQQALLNRGFLVEEFKPMMGGEDAAYYLQERPGAIFFVSASAPGSGPVHTPNFRIDPEALKRGIEFWTTLAIRPR